MRTTVFFHDYAYDRVVKMKGHAVGTTCEKARSSWTC